MPGVFALFTRLFVPSRESILMGYGIYLFEDRLDRWSDPIAFFGQFAADGSLAVDDENDWAGHAVGLAAFLILGIANAKRQSWRTVRRRA
jgi:hypothetical protein